MFSKTKIALSAAIVLSTAFSASAATPRVTGVNQSATYTMIPGYANDGSVAVVPDPDHYGQPQLTGDVTPRNH